MIAKGIFCVYDAFSKEDIRVEINLPGQMKIYKVGGGSQRMEAVDDE